jgi:alcohol dehydrogenase class IV
VRFEFATAGRIIFGEGSLSEVGPAAAALGRRALLVTGKSTERAALLVKGLKDHGVQSEPFAIVGEPTTDDVRRGMERWGELPCDLVIGLGGGSALDTAKAIAALVTNGGVPLDYLEVIGRGLPLTRPSAPCIAIPTTAGTGAEVTRNVVLASPPHKVKVSLRGWSVLPALAVVDPELTYSLPPDITASTGLDALTQIVEPFVSGRANPLTDALCREGLQRIARSLRSAFLNGGDREARLDMSLASLIGGLALANAGLGAAHGFAGPIGGMFSGPHGAICAALLPHVMRTNILALRARHPEAEALPRYQETARLLTGRPDASAEEGAAWVERLCRELRVPRLSVYGVNQADIPLLAEKSSVASSMKANPVALTREEMEAILDAAL